ncbi:hypothetical protein GUITHDRAFT_107305 [Guillardia theta CCMP2712]|uniref:PH domain-containing protein n=1 Tax=Guillardia theta (strain CCMP2712) TaxID=905079 RepID=L1JFN2_GUITC|nr:hypothetical protein GUITHDRAFT_107305 [Guillardia theta CCMP2712]EKX46954.1 hypothetical protein GUITHDRAFT_107305 [Guillardia theta CCMP2712]|eukprot:XP_005833934.1 hypothetical protein GUITHDRAFT_107305 [Guillardia theta CCMP2712]
MNGKIWKVLQQESTGVDQVQQANESSKEKKFSLRMQRRASEAIGNLMQKISPMTAPSKSSVPVPKLTSDDVTVDEIVISGNFEVKRNRKGEWKRRRTELTREGHLRVYAKEIFAAKPKLEIPTYHAEISVVTCGTLVGLSELVHWLPDSYGSPLQSRAGSPITMRGEMQKEPAVVEEEEVVDHELLHWRQVANDERSDRLELEERKRRLVERIRDLKLEMHAANMEDERQEREIEEMSRRVKETEQR